jgi:hypothetical protein
LEKTLKETSVDEKISSAHGLAELMLWKWLYYQQQCNILPITNVQCNSHQNSNDVLHRHWKLNLKFHIEAQRSQIAKATLSKKSKTGSITIPNFKLYYRAIEIKRARYWH